MLVVGHRGCRGLLPENTIVSFKEAIRLGVDAIELDVVVSKDEKIVVSHEPFMSVITCLKPDGSVILPDEDRNYNIYQMTYDKVKAFDCGLKANYKFPEQRSVMSCKPLLLEALLDCEHFIEVKKYKPITYIIELKSDEKLYEEFYPSPRHYASYVLKELRKISCKGTIVLKSFDVNLLNELKYQGAMYQISLLVNKDEDITQKLNLLSFKPEIIGPYFELLSSDIVAYYSSLGYKILPWTVNTYTDMKRIMKLNVMGIITDYPNRLLELLATTT